MEVFPVKTPKTEQCLTFCWHFQIYFLEWKFLKQNFIKNMFIGIYNHWSLVPTMQQAIAGINFEKFVWRH